ncbi:hypothetical protein FZEAL_5290 [Fusarium zealandicum]|uniref:Uncharacterized protein n=1 Tax=Fusarium zealandicum TaxID=1053134 RepID=A0A8H4UK25_9HYPO|nr:hypothetical protein FZEAL_5290 [Fusarium zealandicum]
MTCQVKRGCSRSSTHVLSLDKSGHPLQPQGAWGRVFLQLSNQVECVKAAAAAFGAAFEASLDNAGVKHSGSAWHYYGLALARLRSDFNSEAAGPESLALTSMILTCVEILSQHEQNALAHFLGAVQILNQTYQYGQRAPSAEILSTIENELVKIVLSIGSYAMCQTPQPMHLKSQQAAAGDDVLCEPELAINAAMVCLHRSYQLIESAAPLRFAYPSWKEPDLIMCKAQSDAVAQCRWVLDALAALGARLAAIETFASVPAPMAACDVVEAQRVYGYSIPHPRLNGDGRRVVDSVLSRPNPPLAQGWGHVDYSSLDNWILWSEPIEI